MTLNKNLTGFSCLATGTVYPVDDYFEGSPVSIAQGFPASLRACYSTLPPFPSDCRRGLARYADRLPYTAFPTLGEGSTPLVASPVLARELGIGELRLKLEGSNPTGSHKDRLAPFVVARALDLGKSCVAAASSGNGGVSLAAYAAAAGIRCSIVTTAGVKPCWKKALEAYGADVVLVKTATERWPLMAAKVRSGAWYPSTNYTTPPVGSNCFGMQGYKTLAYELYEDMKDALPDAVIVPTARGDLLWGIYEGFRELAQEGTIRAVPRLYAVEPFARADKILAGTATLATTFPQSTRLISIGGDTVTYQTIEALRESGGSAVAVSDDEAEADIARLGARGFYGEGSSAVVYSAVTTLVREGTLDAASSVVAILTSHGFKEGLRNKEETR